MSSDPTSAELASVSTLDDVANWAGIPGDSIDALSARKALYALLGAEHTRLPRIVGVIDEVTYVNALTTWQVNGANVRLATKSTALLFGNACRIHAGTQSSIAQIAAAAASSAAATVVVTTLALAKSSPAHVKSVSIRFYTRLMTQRLRSSMTLSHFSVTLSTK